MPVREARRSDLPEVSDKPQPAIAEIGHNAPPLEEQVAAEFREELLRDRPDFLRKLDDLVGSADRAQATNEQELGRCGDLVKAYRALLSHIAITHKTVKQPYLDGGRAVDAEKNDLSARVEDAKRRVEGIGNAFVAQKEAEARAERERVAAEQRAAAERAARAEREREEAEREAAEAAARATSEAERLAAQERAEQKAIEAEEAMKAASYAPAALNQPEPVRSDEGATVSGKKDWQSEVTDYLVAFVAVSDDDKVREAIDKAIARRVRAGARTIEGVRIWPVAKANFR